MTQKQIFVFVFLTTSYFVVAQIGDKCTLKRTSIRGTCKLATECPSAEDRAKKGISPTLCGFYQLTDPIVCCEDSAEVNDLTPTNYNPGHNTPVTNSNLRKSQEKCDEYSRAVESIVSVLPLVSDVQPIPIKVPKCDYNTVPLIVGGEPAEPGEFPFMVLVGFNTTDSPWRCGGTLISDRFVLTAAHCTFTRDVGQPTIVRFGELDLTTENDGSQYKDYLLSEVKTHPAYNYPKKYNDIALLKTRDTVQFTTFIRPACLYLQKSINSEKALATGFGRDAFAGDFSDKLMKVGLDLYDNQKCIKTYPANNKDLPNGVVNTMLCAGFLPGGRDTCLGDSGGPLVVTKKGNMCQFFLVGITSFGKLCGERNTPAIYTRVSEYIDWIEKEVW